LKNYEAELVLNPFKLALKLLDITYPLPIIGIEVEDVEQIINNSRAHHINT